MPVSLKESQVAADMAKLLYDFLPGSAITKGRQPIFFPMDGYDLTVVLEGRMRLDELLEARIRRLSEEGTPFISAKENPDY